VLVGALYRIAVLRGKRKRGSAEAYLVLDVAATDLEDLRMTR
jgi:hypothetical protein